MPSRSGDATRISRSQAGRLIEAVRSASPKGVGFIRRIATQLSAADKTPTWHISLRDDPRDPPAPDEDGIALTEQAAAILKHGFPEADRGTLNLHFAACLQAIIKAGGG